MSRLDKPAFSSLPQESDGPGERNAATLCLITSASVVDEKQVAILLCHQNERLGFALTQVGRQRSDLCLVRDCSDAEPAGGKSRADRVSADDVCACPQDLIGDSVRNNNLLEELVEEVEPVNPGKVDERPCVRNRPH